MGKTVSSVTIQKQIDTPEPDRRSQVRMARYALKSGDFLRYVGRTSAEVGAHPEPETHPPPGKKKTLL